MSRLEVRERAEADLPALAEVLARVHETTGYPEVCPPDLAAWLTSSRLLTSLVAVVEGRVVGQVSLATAAEDRALSYWDAALGLGPEALVVIKRLFVEPVLSGRGIGRSLLAAAVVEAHRCGLWPVLDVDARSRRAIRLYERAGFRRVGTARLQFAGRETAFEALCLVGPAPACARARGEG